MKKYLVLLISHAFAVLLGFAGGIYALPILTAPSSPSPEAVANAASTATYSGELRRDLTGSDFFHWGEGTVSVSEQMITFAGSIAPGPDYRLYLVPEFVETESAFNAIKDQSLAVGEVKTFENFMVTIDQPIDLDAFNTVVIWCESFGEFISAAQYR